MHKDLKDGKWHGLRVHYPPESKEETTMFVGEFKDGRYHVLGYIPQRLKPYLTEAEESRGDFGVLTFPTGKRSLADLVEGDIFQFTAEEPNAKPNSVKYLRSA